MKDEIKEIKISKSNHSIVIIKNGVTVKEQFAIDDEILDYITYLQKENDYLKDIVSNTELSDEIKKADKWSKRELYKINYQRLQVNGRLREENERLNNIIGELNKYFEEELDRLAREPSHIYEDSLGKTRLLNENIYEEVQKIKDKLKELKGSDK